MHNCLYCNKQTDDVYYIPELDHITFCSIYCLSTLEDHLTPSIIRDIYVTFDSIV